MKVLKHAKAQAARHGPPILFESMVFTGKTRRHEILDREFHEEVDMRRYATWGEALTGHAEMLAETRAIVGKINALTKGEGDD